jgi:uncharacterized protein YdhG (YjbR/CyaY superfamily)
MKTKTVNTVDEYLEVLPDEKRKTLEFIRSTVKKLVPEATEKLSYGMPTFFTDRALVGYAAFTNHCSFFPWSKQTLKNFSDELSSYKTSAGTIQIPLGKNLPASLIKKIVLARLVEHAEKKAIKLAAKGKKTSSNRGVVKSSQLSFAKKK